jgi:hypothetical protein
MKKQYQPVCYTEERNCLYCKKVFVPNRKDKKYCGENCQKSASRKRQPGWVDKRRPRSFSYKDHKGLICECCGFVAVNKCQLDVDHINGDHSDNSIENLQTLCSNCHRLKTWLNSEYLPKEKRPQK